MTVPTALITSIRLITDAKPRTSAADMAAIEFLAITMPPDKRLAAITNSNLFARGYFVTHKKTIRPSFLLQKVSTIDENGHPNDILLAQGTNDSTTFRPETVDPNTTKT